MLTVEKLSCRPETFRCLTGAGTDTFYKIAELIRPLREERRDNSGEGGGEHSLQGHGNQLFAMLLYCRCYVTCEFIGYFSDCHETAVIRPAKRTEKTAVKAVHIGKKRGITCEDAEYLITDAAEQPVQRPKKGQKKYYSGKKKRHTIKTQYVTGPDGKIYSGTGLDFL